MRGRVRLGQPPNYSWPRKNSQQIRRKKSLLSQLPHRRFGKMRWMTAHFVGEIRLALDRPVDGIETANAPAVLAADATTALEAAFHRGLAQTFPPPRFSLCSSSLAASGSYRQARSSLISAPSERASEAFRVLVERLPGGFARPALTRNSLQPCNAYATRPPRRHRLTPADRTGRVRLRPIADAGTGNRKDSISRFSRRGDIR